MKDSEEQIREILFDLGKDIKIHRIDKDNSVLEIDYEKYIEKLKTVVDGCNPPPAILK
jgi:hypothetical protein